MDIKKLSKLPESQTLEFKQDSSSLEPIIKTIIAFANTAGGIILIGIDDEGTIIGISDPAKIQEQLANSIANRIRPRLLPDIYVAKINNKNILVIQVEHTYGPYALANKDEEKGVYIRLGNTTRLAGKEMIAEMKRANHNPFFDKAYCDDVTISDLDHDLINSTFSKRGTKLDESKLLSLGILSKKGKHSIATNGGVILFGKLAVRQEHFPFAEVRCARFAGTSRAEFIDRLNIEGSILKAIDEVPKFIRRNTRMAGKFGEMKRRDIPEYPVEGVREALVNALAHANYEIHGTRIFVAIYDDKLEIQNPGIMPPGMSMEQFKAGVSRIRNPVIARTFGELGLVEEWGSGYKRINNACKKDGYPEPTWEELGTVLRVTFYPHPEVGELGAKLGAKPGAKPGAEPGAKRGTKLGTKLPLSNRYQVGTALTYEQTLIQLINFCSEPRRLQEMMETAGWRDKTKFRKKFVRYLLDRGLLKMSLPEKLSSPKQRYLLTDKGHSTKNIIECTNQIKNLLDKHDVSHHLRDTFGTLSDLLTSEFKKYQNEEKKTNSEAYKIIAAIASLYNNFDEHDDRDIYEAAEEILIKITELLLLPTDK